MLFLISMVCMQKFQLKLILKKAYGVKLLHSLAYYQQFRIIFTRENKNKASSIGYMQLIKTSQAS